MNLSITQTVDKIDGDCTKFRILLLGKAGCGKSSLINKVFGIEAAIVSHQEPGSAEIERELTSPQNSRFILHVSQDFPPNSESEFIMVKDFIQERMNKPKLKDRLHAIWICMSTPHSGECIDQTGVERIVDLAYKKLPLIIVLTKFDVLVATTLNNMLGDLDFGDKDVDVEPQADGRVKAAHKLNEVLKHVPHNLRRLMVPVSTNQRFEDTIQTLIKLFCAEMWRFPGIHMRDQPGSLIWSIAQCEDVDTIVAAIIIIGCKRYWSRLGSGISLATKTLKECLSNVHTDIVTIWDIQDSSDYLAGDGFKARMSHLVDDLASINLHDPCATPTPTNLAATLAGATVHPIGIAIAVIGAADRAAKWVCDVYEGTPQNIACVMGYIVDLIIIMRFLSISHRSATYISGPIEEETVDAIREHVSSGNLSKAHSKIRKFVCEKNMVWSVDGRDIVLEEIVHLIQEFCDISRLLTVSSEHGPFPQPNTNPAEKNASHEAGCGSTLVPDLVSSAEPEKKPGSSIAQMAGVDSRGLSSSRRTSTKNLLVRRSIVFFGEIGAGKSSAINLLGTGTLAPVSNDSRPCTKASASYEVTLNGTTYDLWDTRGLGNTHRFFHAFLPSFMGGRPEKELKKLLKQRLANREIDLLIYCVRGSRVSKGLSKYYNEFCVITRHLAVPVVIVVTHLEKERDMEDWWHRNSSNIKELGMQFDDHACITTLLEHPRRAESKKRLVDLITKNRHWEVTGSRSFSGCSVQGSTSPVPFLRGVSDPRRAMDRASVGDGSISRCSSHSSGSPSRAPSPTGSDYHSASSPTESISPNPTVGPPSPRIVTTSVQVPSNPERAGDRPHPSSEETSSVPDSLHSMLHSSSRSSNTSYSEMFLEPCTDENEDHLSELPFRRAISIVRRRRGWASYSGAFGDVWECDLVSGHTSRMVAVKAVKIGVSGLEDVERHKKKFRRELKIWGRLQHRNIVPLLGVVSGFGPLPSTVSPWFRNGSLSSYLAVRQLTGSQRHRLLGDIAIGLRYLHSRGIIHGDLHSGNVLIDDDRTACITDFGLSFIGDFLGTSYLKSSICGVVHFTDPALVQRVYNSQNSVFYPTRPCDIYSFGGLILHVLSGKKPYDEISAQKVFLAILKGERPQIPSNLQAITPWHKKLMLGCWDFDESKRPSVDDLAKMFDRQ